MNKTNFIIGAVAVVALLFGVTAYFSPNTVTQVVDKVGAVVGPESTFDYSCTNGVCTHYRKSAMVGAGQALGGASGSTTPCALRAPTTGTSTLTYHSVQIATPTSTAAYITVAKSATPYATTTAIVSTFEVASGEKLNLTTTSTTTLNNGVLDAFTFAPGEYVVVSAMGAAGPYDRAGFQWGGTCTAEFKAHN